MTRLFLQEKVSIGQSVIIKGEKAHYLSSVLRCRPDDTIEVTDTNSSSYSAKILSLTKKHVCIEIAGELMKKNESPLEIVLIQGLLKADKMDLVIQKATELGVNGVMPVSCERSQLRETRKVPRWMKIAEEASRQCGRSSIPLVHETASFEDAIKSCRDSCGIIFWEKGGISFSSALSHIKDRKKICLCVGPEGGFSEREVKYAELHEFIVSSMGRRILRAETAAIAAVSIIQQVIGDLGI